MKDPQLVFVALADPTRRRLLDRLVAGGPATATGLSEGLPMSRQAVAKHLGVLHDAGLVSKEPAGRETRFVATPQALGEAREWMDRVGDQWEERLERLRHSLE